MAATRFYGLTYFVIIYFFMYSNKYGHMLLIIM